MRSAYCDATIYGAFEVVRQSASQSSSMMMISKSSPCLRLFAHQSVTVGESDSQMIANHKGSFSVFSVRADEKKTEAKEENNKST